MSTQILAITNQKGGVGKTTTAINLASFMAEEGSKVLLVDMDAQGNAGSGIGLKSEEITTNVYDALMDAAYLKDAIYPTPFDKLHVLPSTRDLAGAEVELVGEARREHRLKEALDRVRDYYEVIIIDCPPSLGLLTVNALVAADKAIIPVQTEYFALEGIANLLNTLNLIKSSLNPRLEIGGILLTMFDKRTSLNRQVVQNARRFFKELIFDTIIPRNIRLTEAPSHGMPIALYNPSSKGAMAYYQLAQEVESRVRQ